MRFTATEPVGRFALHVLPQGFMRVHYYGFLANAVRVKKLKAIRLALKTPEPILEVKDPVFAPACPRCGHNHWHFMGAIVRWHWLPG